MNLGDILMVELFFYEIFLVFRYRKYKSPEQCCTQSKNLSLTILQTTACDFIRMQISQFNVREKNDPDVVSL